MNTSTKKVLKRATNVSLRADILESAKALEINISEAAERGVGMAVAEAQAEQWIEKNKAALDSSNAFVEQHGVPLSKYRQF